MRARGLLAMLAGLSICGRAGADPVWDPTEIARLSQQAAQLATNLSATIETLETFEKLATQVGALGARTSFISSAPASLARYAALPTAAMPAATDAATLLNSRSPAATQQRQSRQIWQAASQTVSAEGLAVAQVANQDAGGAISRSKDLAATAAGTQDLRADLQANSAVGRATSW